MNTEKLLLIVILVLWLIASIGTPHFIEWLSNPSKVKKKGRLMGTITINPDAYEVDEYEAVSEILSTIKPKNTREKNDLYRTRPKVAQSLANLLTKRLAATHVSSRLRGGTTDPLYVLEPGCYDGPFLRAFHKAWICTGKAPLYLTGVDIVDERPDFASNIAEYEKLDYTQLTDNDKDFLKSEVIIGNPPFSLAEQFLRTSRELVTNNGLIGLVLQIGFLGARERVVLFEEIKPWEVHVLAPRPGFIREGKKDGTDMREYVFAIWKSWNPSQTTLCWHDWKDKP